MRFNNFIFLATLLAFIPVRGQESAPPKDTPTVEQVEDLFFSGLVAEFTTEKIVVSRAVLGKPAEKRTFLITQDTKVEGKLKNKVRVTVRYQTNDQGDVAAAILVRTSPKSK